MVVRLDYLHLSLSSYTVNTGFPDVLYSLKDTNWTSLFI